MSAPPKTWRKYFDANRAAAEDLSEAQRAWAVASERLDRCLARVRELDAQATAASAVCSFEGDLAAPFGTRSPGADS